MHTGSGLLKAAGAFFSCGWESPLPRRSKMH